MKSIRCILFDLDGTLIDSAPDLVYACNKAIGELGLDELPIEALKPWVSGGARAMLNHCLNHHQSPAELDSLMERMLELYQQNIAVQSSFFEGIDCLLEFIESHGLSWGIVTNKQERFTLPLLKALNIYHRTSCVISGDTLAEQKPHPLPLLEACKRLGFSSDQSIYIGDARRDIEAGKNAGMKTLAALYGYISQDDPPDSWGADGMIGHPREILDWLK